MNENELNLRQAMIDSIEAMTGIYPDNGWSLSTNQLVILAELLAMGTCASEMNLRLIKLKIKKFDNVPAYKGVDMFSECFDHRDERNAAKE